MMLNLITILLFGLSCFFRQDGKEKIDYLKYGTSWGMCEGYCFKEIAIDSKRKVETQIWQKGKGNQPHSANKVDTTVIDKNYLNQLIKKIDPKAFYKLPYLNGCPDCDDGGAEWLELSINGKIHRVTFEYAKENKALTPLLKELRKKE